MSDPFDPRDAETAPPSEGADATLGVGRFKHKRKHAFRPGDVCAGRYCVVRQMASGGMAEIYAVFDDVEKEHRALKTLQLKFKDHAEVTRRAAAEARTLLRMRHNHLVRVFDTGVDGDRLFYVMPLLEGCDLRDLLIHNKAFPIGVALDLAVQLCTALRALHEIEVLHRDLKPENAFVSPAGGGRLHLRLLDLGAAKFYREQITTLSGNAMGTLQYMSPEQASGETRLGPETDIYALGIILFELIAGLHPAQLSRSPPIVPVDWTEWHRGANKPRLDVIAPAAPVPLVRFIASCLAPLHERPPSMALVLDALTSLRRAYGTLGCERGNDVTFPTPTEEREPPVASPVANVQIAIASRITPQLGYARTEEQRPEPQKRANIDSPALATPEPPAAPATRAHEPAPSTEAVRHVPAHASPRVQLAAPPVRETPQAERERASSPVGGYSRSPNPLPLMKNADEGYRAAAARPPSLRVGAAIGVSFGLVVAAAFVVFPRITYVSAGLQGPASPEASVASPPVQPAVVPPATAPATAPTAVSTPASSAPAPSAPASAATASQPVASTATPSTPPRRPSGVGPAVTPSPPSPPVKATKHEVDFGAAEF